MPSVESLVAEVTAAFEEIHGKVDYELQFAESIDGGPCLEIYGNCDFSHSPPRITLRSTLSDSELIEYFCHELAHLVCGLDADHGEKWQATNEELSDRFWVRRLTELSAPGGGGDG